MFRYVVITTNGLADGVIEAESEYAAKQVLTAQYSPEEHGFVDGEGEAVEHKVLSIELAEV